MRARHFVLAGLTAAGLGLGSTASAAPFIVGTANATGHEIFQFDLATNTKSTLLDTAALPGCNVGPACEPDSLVFDSLGRIIYTSEDRGELHRFTPGVPGSDQTLATGLLTPKDLVLAPDGLSVYVSEAGGSGLAGHTIDRITLCAAPPCTVTKLNGGLPYATSDGPHGLAFVGNNLYANIGDRTGGAANSHLAQLDPITGAILVNQTPTLSGLDGLTFDLDPAHPFLYATSVLGGFVYEFNPANLAAGPTRTLFTGQLAGTAIDGLTFDFAGNLYIAGFAIPNGKLFKCGINSGSCTSLATINGIDDLAPFNQTNNTPVPEPASLLLLGTGLLGAARLRRRRRA